LNFLCFDLTALLLFKLFHLELNSFFFQPQVAAFFIRTLLFFKFAKILGPHRLRLFFSPFKTELRQILNFWKLKLSSSYFNISEINLVFFIGASLELSSPMKLIIKKYLRQVSLFVVLKLRFV
jgi:hypothetical protein